MTTSSSGKKRQSKAQEAKEVIKAATTSKSKKGTVQTQPAKNESKTPQNKKKSVKELSEEIKKIKPKPKYAIAFPTDEYYALEEGPFEDIQEPLKVVPDREDSLIIQLSSNDKLLRALYLWNSNKARWIPLVKK